MKLEKQTFNVNSFDPKSCSKSKCITLNNHMTRKYQGFKTKIKKVCQMGTVRKHEFKTILSGVFIFF